VRSKFSDEEIHKREAFWLEELNKYPNLKYFVSVKPSTYGRRIHCMRCGALVHTQGLHPHMNSVVCEARKNSIQAVREGYFCPSQMRSPFNVAVLVGKSMAMPFLKQFKTYPKQGCDRRRAEVQDRWWVKAWWFDLYRKLENNPERKDILHKVRKLWDEEKYSEIEDIINLINMASEHD